MCCLWDGVLGIYGDAFDIWVCVYGIWDRVFGICNFWVFGMQHYYDMISPEYVVTMNLVIWQDKKQKLTDVSNQLR